MSLMGDSQFAKAACGRHRPGWIATALLCAGIVCAAPAGAQQIPEATMSIPQAALNSSFGWNFSAGLDYSGGKYGAKCALTTSLSCTTTGTTIIAIPVTAMVQIERLRLQVTLPYVDIEGPGKFAGDFGIPVIVAPASTDPKHRSGLGDAQIGAAWIFSRETTFLPALEIAGIVKLPTALNGSGTSKTDYGRPVESAYRKLSPGAHHIRIGVGDINGSAI